MSDLTRRALEAHQFIEDDTPPVDWNKFDDARAILENSAPPLARQVEAVEAVVEQFAYAATLDRGLSEWEGMCDHFVKLFRNALEGATP